MFKSTYILFFRVFKYLFSTLGLLKLLEKSKSKFFKHIRSLFSIYDYKDLSSLDLCWWTYGSIRYVEDFIDKKNKNFEEIRVFEYGAGSSTLWLSKRVKKIISVEHDKLFFDDIKKFTRGNKNIEIFLKSPSQLSKDQSSNFMSQKKEFLNLCFSDYVNAINEFDYLFDIIVIDGRARNACLDVAINRLSENGIIVFDNSHRMRYKKHIKSLNFKKIIYSGFTPSLPYPDETTLIIK